MRRKALSLRIKTFIYDRQVAILTEGRIATFLFTGRMVGCEKRRFAFVLALIMAATSSVTAFAVQEEVPTEPSAQTAESFSEPASAAESTITYRISDEMYQKGVRFYNTDAQERTDTITTGQPFQVKSFTAMKYNGDKLGGVSWKTLNEIQGYK